MTYMASQDLIDIFTKNGFEDVTKSRYPEHYLHAEKNGYNPSNCKRALAITGRTKSYVLFDYINICPSYKSVRHSSSTILSADEVKSIITFFKLPTSIQNNLTSKHNTSIASLHELYSKVKENPKLYRSNMYFQIVRLFENINL